MREHFLSPGVYVIEQLGTGARGESQMFDKLIESEPEGADFKNRRNYFMVSSLVVGALFMTAVVISIYAADFGLGHDTLELVEMIAPVQPAPEMPQPHPPATASQVQTQIAIRQVNMPSVNDSTEAPESISTTRNTDMIRPVGRFIIGPLNSGPVDPGTSGRGSSGSGSGGEGLTQSAQVAENMTIPEPPPVVKKSSKARIQTLGVINGRASYLPKPVYSAAAIALHADGKVDVQVAIDETGKVISANAVSGHVLLRRAAEQAARNAKFTPTLLSNVPVKVTGVIVYNFMR
jgi:TonB family protein